jgi:hypothetical protein
VTETTMQLLVSGAEDARIVLHDVRHASAGERGAGAVAALAGHASWVLSADVSPDGRMVLSGCVPLHSSPLHAAEFGILGNTA